MAESNPPVDPNQPDPNRKDGPAGAPQPPPAKPRLRRGWWWKVPLALLILLIVLVLLGPTIAGTSPVRHYVLGKVNQNLNGSVAIEDWSISWTRGIEARGIKLLDDRGAEVASIARVRTGLALIDAIRGRYHLGETVVDEPNLEQLVIYPDGSNNLQKLVKESPGKPKSSHEPSEKEKSKTPLDVSGDIHINRLRALVHDQRTNQTIVVTPDSGMTLKLKGLAEPIENAAAIVLRIGSEGAPGSVKLNGVATLDNKGAGLQSADEKLEVTALPLQGANPFLALAGQELQLGGVANGAIAVKMTDPQELSADGQIIASGFSVKGKALSDESYAASRVTIPVKVTRVGSDARTARITIQSLGIESPDANADVAGDFSLDALQRALGGKPPGGDGKLSLTLSVPNFKPIADQLPRTLHLQDGVKIASGRLYHETNLWLSKDKAVIDSRTDVEDVSGSNKGQAVALSPIHSTADVTLLPSATGKAPDLRDLAITLVSGFAQIKGGGKTEADLNLAGDIDLPKFRKEIGQFVDFGKVDLGGRAQFALSGSGDVSKPGSPITAGANVTVTDLKVAGIEGVGTIEQKLIALKADGTVQRDADDRMTGVDSLAATLRIGDQAAPTLDAALRDGKLVMAAAGNAEASVYDMLRGGSVSLHVNLPKANDLLDNLQKKPAARPAGLALADSPQDQGRRRTATDAPSPRDAAHAAAASPPTTQPLPPLKVLDGVATVQFALARDSAAHVTSLRDGLIRIEKLNLQRGDSRYNPQGNPIDLQFTGDLSAAEKLQGITISKLDGSIPGGTVKLVKPLALTKLDAAAPAADGAFELAGKIDDVAPLLETLQARPKGQGYPYHGAYVITQSLGTQGDTIALNGKGTIDDFRVDPTAPANSNAGFSEKQVALVDNLSYDGKQKNLAISALKLDMAGSDALHLSAVGSLLGVSGKQEFKDFKLTLGYDLAKLWPIIYGMLSPEDQKDLKDAKLAGKYEKVFTLAGGYPAGKSWNESIRTLTMNGGLAIDLFDAMGIKLEKLDLPVALAGGVLRTTSVDGKQPVAPASLNGGKLDLSGAAVNFNGPEPRLTTPKDWKLLAGATINPMLGNTMGKYINPVFVNSERAKGLLDVTVTYCEGVALGDAMKTTDSGKAKIVFSLRDMDIANPLGSLMIGSLMKGIPAGDVVNDVLGALGGKGSSSGSNKGFSLGSNSSQADAFTGDIRNAVVTLDAGQTTQDITLELVDPSTSAAAAAKQAQTPRAGQAVPAAAAEQPKPQAMLLTFKGDIRLSDLKQNLDVNFPTPLFVKFIPHKGFANSIQEIFPNGIPLTLKGHTNKPEIDVGAFVKQAGSAKLQQLIGGANKGGEKGGDNATDKPAKSDDPIGGLLDAIGGKKKDKDKKK
jgi:hypothetical protein